MSPFLLNRVDGLRKNGPLLCYCAYVFILFYKAVQVGTLHDTERLTALESTSLVSLLLPAVFSQLVKIASSDTSAAVRVLNLVKKLLENVVKINKKLEKHREVDCQLDERYYAVVESDHPYKPATISRYRLQFPNDVQWMSLEFDPKCGTAQAEDYLHVYCEAMKDTGDRSGDKDKDFDSYWLVLKRFFGSDNWPTGSIVLPGNSLLFSLESASEYAKDDKNSNFGFRLVNEEYCAISRISFSDFFFKYCFHETSVF